VTISVCTGLLVAKFLLPLFNKLMVTKIDLSYFSYAEISVALITFAVVLGMMAGYYPAWLVSKFKTTAIVKSTKTYKINPRFSKFLVITQFTVCIVLMIAAFVMNRQMQYISNKDLGFDKEQVLMVKNP